jgi:hypothetical protein
MIKGWIRFNESVDGRFTEEMAMEIVYYFSEDSKPSKSIEKLFFDNPETNNLFNFYESGYDEYKASTKELYGVVNSGSPELKEKIFQVYNMIREERNAFPTVAEIEDIFLDMIDEGYSFVIYSSQYDYKIKIYKDDDSLDNFVKYTKFLGERIKRLNVNPLKSTLSKAERLNGFYNQLESGKDRYEVNEFQVVIRRTGWQKSGRDGSWSPE